MEEVTKIVQFRYYSKKHINYSNSFPKDLNDELLWPNADSFIKYPNIEIINIQTIPGTKLYLNQSQEKLDNYNLTPIIIGPSGILNMVIREQLSKSLVKNYNNLIQVRGLVVDEQSKQNLNNLENGYLIITIVFKEKI